MGLSWCQTEPASQGPKDALLLCNTLAHYALPLYQGAQRETLEASLSVMAAVGAKLANLPCV